LADVAVPVLVVHRRSDFVPFGEAELLIRGIRGARLVELEGSDHLPWVGDTGGILSAMADFVGEVAGRPGRRAVAGAARPRWPVTGWEALTGAERRVAGLVAGGMTNREVAESMFLSPARPPGCMPGSSPAGSSATSQSAAPGSR
jgi:hypothetical protein